MVALSECDALTDGLADALYEAEPLALDDGLMLGLADWLGDPPDSLELSLALAEADGLYEADSLADGLALGLALGDRLGLGLGLALGLGLGLRLGLADSDAE